MPAGNGQLASPALSPIIEYGAANRAFVQDVSEDEVIENGNPGEKIDIELERRGRRRSSDNRGLRLSSRQIRDLTTSPDSLPLRRLDDELREEVENSSYDHLATNTTNGISEYDLTVDRKVNDSQANGNLSESAPSSTSARAPPTPIIQRRSSASKTSKSKPQLISIDIDDANSNRTTNVFKPSPSGRQASPMPSILPLPPLSLPTYLHLELSSSRPSPLYIHRSATSDFPYESSKVKFERIQNFLLLPPILEQVLWFGAIACLDAWLYTFTILPLRFLKALTILGRWWTRNAAKETLDLGTFVYGGLGRVWARRNQDVTAPGSRQPSISTSPSENEQPRKISEDSSNQHNLTFNGNPSTASQGGRPRKPSGTFRHRRTRSTPSVLLPNHKADLLQGLLILCSCTILMWFDASRMYHSIRGQAAIKLYVIYNVLEVFDRLFAAIGQDVLECLFSKETLERNSDGRSKVLRPLWMFVLALIYNVIHSTALFYQVITLNVAVNSYSNALLTLLMSNQFVEIKGTVFKKFEKENLFQLTCADVVERFQLWLMLLIIALRNIVEVGGLSISLNTAFGGEPTNPLAPNATAIPLSSGFVVPKAFTLLPKWTGEVLGPFLIVLGSEALVDWCKHAYINKFNNTKPQIYSRFLDVLAKDYYSHAFADQNLTKRLGLPVIPLSCLFIRACMQTYHMFLATHMPAPLPASTAILEPLIITSSSPTNSGIGHNANLSGGISGSSSSGRGMSAATTAALQHIDRIFRRALGSSSFGSGAAGGSPNFRSWTVDDLIAFATMAIFFLALYLVLLAFKLVLGMSLLSYARRRYKSMKERERGSVVETHGRRVGGWGTVEVNEDKRRWIYDDDPEALSQLREKENRGRAKAEKGEMNLDHVSRYSMAAKRIW